MESFREFCLFRISFSSRQFLESNGRKKQGGLAAARRRNRNQLQSSRVAKGSTPRIPIAGTAGNGFWATKKNARKFLRAPAPCAQDPIQLAQGAGAWFIMRAGAHMVELADTLL
jgi:hypothetical protein